ncbi:hypothetical protein [Endozoicomonas sp. SCSIO W0465]|uniref:hypothetical protein n=1 Tax=Endozoicomonas sp. SCSIO W0465 TaxID=2918516 RepID=UPI0020761634|nr:hypothetical protein [Endozoicomonas sp. SCSIO W0465]USE34221.1 hypothetical protein MJO57_18865 [Endozoicomonas sp. SCSIO W0465]
MNTYGESFHNPFSDYRFPKALVRVIYHQETGQSGPLGLSDKTKAQPQKSDENILYTSQSGLRIDRAGSMVFEADSQSHSIGANHPPLDVTLKDNEFDFNASASVSGESLTSSPDKASQKAYLESKKRKASRKACKQSEKRKVYQKAYEQSEKRKAYRKAYRESEKGKAVRRAYQKAYEQSEKRKAYLKAYLKDYQQSEKRKAYLKAYRESEKGKAYRKAYRESEKGKAYQKVYEQSEKRKAYRKAYRESDKRKAYEQSEKRKAYQKAYQKAYHEVFKNTGDREQAKIAGKQASAFIRESNKAKNSELESISISPPPSASMVDYKVNN